MIIQADKIIYGDATQAPGTDALCVREGKIEAVGPLDALTAQYPDEAVVRYESATILPGLVEMHTHCGFDGGPDPRGFNEYMVGVYGAARLHEGLKNGVTTVRDVGSVDGLGPTLKDAAKRGFIRIPRLLTSNNGICMTGGHGADLYGMAIECDGEWEVRKAVRAQIKAGADWIKVLSSEGFRGAEFSQAELDAAVDEAHRFGVPASLHAGYVPSVDMGIRTGFDTIEHGTFLTPEGAQTMKKNGQVWVPTIACFLLLAGYVQSGGSYLDGSNDQYALAAGKQISENFKPLYDTGVKVACGTDMVMPGLPALPVAHEAAAMVQCGITPLQAIEAATKNGADALKLGDTVGQLKAGYNADILIVDGDAAADITALQKVRAVYQGGALAHSTDWH